eukprot:1985591-Pleurochrysis_carterae.AAC.1
MSMRPSRVCQALERERKIENEFMSVTSHEVRNPLNGTVAYLQFALAALSRINTTGASAGGVQLSPAAQLPEGLSGSCSSRSSHGAADAADSVSDGLFEATQMAQGALACTTVALRVLENLTTLETLRQGSLTLTAAPEQLSDVLAEVKEGLAPQLAAASHGKATLRVALQPELQRRRVWCDRKMLLQVAARVAAHARDADKRRSGLQDRRARASAHASVLACKRARSVMQAYARARCANSLQLSCACSGHCEEVRSSSRQRLLRQVCAHARLSCPAARTR